MRRKIPKEYLKELRGLARDKREFLANRINIVRKSVIGLQKFDELSKPYEKKTDGIMQMHPHIPSKMVSSIGFGDGKTRKRHHFRCEDKIRIGEITLNEDLVIVDESLPLSERIIKFGPEHVKKTEQFEISIERSQSRIEPTEDDTNSNG